MKGLKLCPFRLLTLFRFLGLFPKCTELHVGSDIPAVGMADATRWKVMLLLESSDCDVASVFSSHRGLLCMEPTASYFCGQEF